MIDTESNGERQLRKIAVVIPDAGDGAVRIADYEVASRKRVGGRWQDAPVKIFALGAGPRAVGSVTLNKVDFSERSATIPPAGQSADLHVNYVLKQYYDRVSVQVLRSCGLGWCGTGTSADTAAPGEPGQWNKAWPISSRTRPGNFIASVKAWLYCDGITAEQYRRCGDQAAWAQGQSAAIAVTQ
ncbi:hypothetical protein [Sandarakinorhabdus sp. DWP1-3-1]|uniref:hypothetical protein n=1 Tax=Sandarakinorhabdus sp. DWP1-3-1 TaxID=2804627 RepID=UPI003CFB79D7